MIDWIRKQPAAVRLWSSRRLHLFGISKEDGAAIRATTEFRRNHLPDLEAFEQTERWLTRDAFLASARQRIDAGEDVYTRVEDGRLVCYGWLRRDCRRNRYAYVDQTVEFAPGTALIYNGWVHPAARGRGLHQEAQRFRIADVLAEPAGRYLFSAVEEPNRAAHKSAVRAGLRPQAVLETRTRFGRQRKSAQRADGAYPFEVEVRSDPVTIERLREVRA